MNDDLPRLSRRRVIQSLAIVSSSLVAGCGRSAGHLPPNGEIVGANRARGHRLRDRTSLPTIADGEWSTVDVVVVGGGIAGLVSARELHKPGNINFVVLELEDQPGGTSRGDQGNVTSFPWGAHYLPVPMADNRELLQLLEEMGMIVDYDGQGRPRFVEEYLCREPEERLYFDGQWHAGLQQPEMSPSDRLQWQRFQAQIDYWVGWRDASDRRAFGLPIARTSDSAELRELDRLSMAEWLDLQGFDSESVKWEVDYACRDDYGTELAATSAWAGLFYFASRVDVPGDSPQPLLTWPEGNARLVRHLADVAGSRVITGQTVVSIEPGATTGQPVRIMAIDGQTGSARGWLARKVIFAAPQFVARHVIRGYAAERGEAISAFSYAPWLVANLHLHGRPRETGVQPAWDNVLRNSPGLGYVIATHQSGRDHGPTVFTYYRPLSEMDPPAGRNWLEQLDWSASAELVLADLERAHPDLRSLVTRLDVMHWGHAMIRPTPGFRFSDARRICEQPFHDVHFAHTDLSGVALMEEAFYHGVRAGQEVLAKCVTNS